MPKDIINYSNTIIYKLVCNDLDIKDTYVGHTTNFIKRKASHKERCNDENGNKYHLKVYQIMRRNGGWDNWSMIEIEKFPCNDHNEATKQERYWYELLNANMNKLNPNRTKKEYQDANRDYLLMKKREYHEKNKEEINLKRSVTYPCICGCSYTLRHKARHEKSKKHQEFIQQQIITE